MSIHSLAFNGNDLYVGRPITYAGGNSSSYIARWFKSVAAAAVTKTFTAPQAAPLSFNKRG